MIVSEIEDLLRSKLGKPDMSPELLKQIRQLGRSEIESLGDFHWMARHTDIIISAGVSDFLVKVDFIIPDFQSFRFLQVQRNSRWRTILPGSWLSTMEGITVTGEGFPERCTYENGTLKISPIPDDEFQGNLFYFASTEEPEDILETDDLYTLWPQLALYSSLAVGERLVNQNQEASAGWTALRKEQIDMAVEYTKKLLGEPSGQISTSAAAKILQAAGAE